jgi:hypothetical protein
MRSAAGREPSRAACAGLSGWPPRQPGQRHRAGVSAALPLDDGGASFRTWFVPQSGQEPAQPVLP